MVIVSKVRASIEEQRLLLGLTRDQVLICTDMYGSTSGTYDAQVSLCSVFELDGLTDPSIVNDLLSPVSSGSLNWFFVGISASQIRLAGSCNPHLERYFRFGCFGNPHDQETE